MADCQRGHCDYSAVVKHNRVGGATEVGHHLPGVGARLKETAVCRESCLLLRHHDDRSTIALPASTRATRFFGAFGVTVSDRDGIVTVATEGKRIQFVPTFTLADYRGALICYEGHDRKVWRAAWVETVAEEEARIARKVARIEDERWFGNKVVGAAADIRRMWRKP